MSVWLIIESTLSIITFIIFGVMGYKLSAQISRPTGLVTWLILFISVVLLGFISLNIALISDLGFAIYLNATLTSLGLGILVGFVLRKEQLPNGE